MLLKCKPKALHKSLRNTSTACHFSVLDIHLWLDVTKNSFTLLSRWRIMFGGGRWTDNTIHQEEGVVVVAAISSSAQAGTRAMRPVIVNVLRHLCIMLRISGGGGGGGFFQAISLSDSTFLNQILVVHAWSYIRSILTYRQVFGLSGLQCMYVFL